MDTTAHLTCPKCRGAMVSYERSGVIIDQCGDCRGIFLDRGELERLVDLSAGAAPSAPPAAPVDRVWREQQPAPQQRQWDASRRHDWDDDSDSYRGGHSYSGSPKHRKKSSFLKEFLDF